MSSEGLVIFYAGDPDHSEFPANLSRNFSLDMSHRENGKNYDFSPNGRYITDDPDEVEQIRSAGSRWVYESDRKPNLPFTEDEVRRAVENDSRDQLRSMAAQVGSVNGNGSFEELRDGLLSLFGEPEGGSE